LKVQDEMNDLEVSFKKNEFCGSWMSAKVAHLAQDS
jgi:hypothetical protein